MGVAAGTHLVVWTRVVQTVVKEQTGVEVRFSYNTTLTPDPCVSVSLAHPSLSPSPRP